MWHHHHKIHHATSANLDKRGIGDVWTMTKDEYMSAPEKTRRFYRLFRNPFIMFIIGPFYVIFFQNRVTKKTMTKQEKTSVYLTNLFILLVGFTLSMLFGLKNYLLVQLPAILLAHSVGIWLFLIQHNFEDVEWERTDNWDYLKSALKGSSFLKLPAVFQWFSGNIGYHHVHHLSPRIPNYNLERCHNENEMFSVVKPIYFFSTFRFLKLHLWDEKNQKMISFSALRQPVYA
jgi:omega-6 fatty acid desaturase (delta-12 desaturase)